MSLLEVKNLDIEYQTKKGSIKAANDVSFSIDQNEKFGLVGESGCGKSTIAKSLLRLLPDNGAVTNGSIMFDGTDLVSTDEKTLRDIRWDEISFITQSAMNALDPVYTIGNQIVEAIQTHENVSKKNARNRAGDLVELVGLERERIDSYPHQLSGGMRQRAMIAMALALNPRLIIADEPTTALDVITQDHILEEINTLTDTINSSLFIITHDISVVAETCDKVGVMYGGELVEVGPIEEVFVNPQHPYTLGLLNAFPTIEGGEDELITMPGQPPDLQDPPQNCSFYERCPYREERCAHADPELTRRSDSQYAACFVSEERDIGAEYESVVDKEEVWLKL
ncbi:ABC transporter ATP-binding protein [Halalkalirubrum salinum]|uniref:ABC transporter ATP-binding protein n=1 Tax=Halalkalirubrum salinum TaxID=2563889 RepID=UPI0010FAF35E|nr:ABC transporter ATP-binding protein [Halalkalirubrum salinum]